MVRAIQNLRRKKGEKGDASKDDMLHKPLSTYSHHSIKRTRSIKRPGLEIFKKSLLNVPFDQKNEGLSILLYCLY